MPEHMSFHGRRRVRGGPAFVLACAGILAAVSWLAVERMRDGFVWSSALACVFVGLALYVIHRHFIARQRELARTVVELEESERLMKETGELAKVGGWDFDPVTGAGRWTEEVARIHDLDPHVSTSKDMGLQFYPGESRERIGKAVQAAIEHGTPYDLELEFVSARGVRKWVRTICHPVIQDGKVVKIRGAFVDITRRKETELKLRQAYEELRQTQQAVMQQERLRALGQMASGIAHDINNAISPVMLYTESLLEQEKNLSPRARDYLETIQRAIEDVAHTVARMREFYRQRQTQLTLTPVDVNRTIRQVLDLTRARWSDMAHQRGADIQVQVELGENLPPVMGAESEIREALTNLIFNAVDAMPEGGTLTLRTSLAGGGPDARRVRLEVCDTGIGMDEDTRRRCLEPFFTTKGERGTGLGLAMVYGMIRRHSADLDIVSAPGRGTTVRMDFVLHADPGAAGQDTAAVQRPRPMRILVVDDDPLLLRSVCDTLEADGHAVTMGEGGEAGIEAFRAAYEQGGGFDVVVTDLGMPHVDGRKVAAAIKALQPKLPVILLTGWGQRMVAEGEMPPGVDRILSKPPKINELRAALTAIAG